MKFKALFLSLLLLAAYGCDDDISQVGSGIQPGKDKIEVSSNDFQITAATYKVDSVYTLASKPILGVSFDPYFGQVRADFLCQFFCPENFKLEYEPIDNKIDSVKLLVYYNYAAGDSTTPMELSVYKLNKVITNSNHFSKFDPSTMYDKKDLLGRQMYTSERSNKPNKVPVIQATLDLEFGQRFFDELKNNPESFKDQDAFNKYFPGVFVTNTYGDGSMIEVKTTALIFYYQAMMPKKVEDKEKSTKEKKVFKTIMEKQTNSTFFTTTNEVVQMNRVANESSNTLFDPSSKFAYIDAPAGVALKTVFPTRKIAKDLKGSIINAYPLVLSAENIADGIDVLIEAPEYLMLMPTDSVTSFFEEQHTERTRPKSAFLAHLDAKSMTYNFGNVAAMVSEHIRKTPDKDLDAVVIPVNRIISVNNSYNSVDTITLRIDNSLIPSAVKIAISPEKLTSSVLSSKLAN